MPHRWFVYCTAAMGVAASLALAGCGDTMASPPRQPRDAAGSLADDGGPGRDDASGGAEDGGAAGADGAGGNAEASPGDDAGWDANGWDMGGLDGGDGDACCPDIRPPLCSDGICDDGVYCSVDRCNPITSLCEHVAPDRDGDGIGDSTCIGLEGRPLGTNCNDDGDPRAGFPDGPGVAAPGGCDGYDNDCDGMIDEGCECTTGSTRPCGSRIGTCMPGLQTCALGTWGEACDGGVAPANELCGNGLDDDCNGSVDDVSVYWLVDADGDGAGSDVASGCPVPDHTVPVGSPHDCDDGDPTIAPGVAERCNGRDDNCNGLVDEGLASWWWLDDDHDGFGLDTGSVLTCSPPPGYVPMGGDCEDDPIKFPTNPEICDGFNNDCDETVDEGCPCAVEGETRPCGRTVATCTAGTQRCFRGVWLGLCEGGVRPGTETCNGIDDDCDGAVDEGLTVPKLRDSDGDGYGGGDPELVCPGAAAHADVGGDCDSSDPRVNPGVTAFADHARGGWPPWDYNCDTWEEPEHSSPRLITCASGGDPCAHLGARWIETTHGGVIGAARCGETGTLYGCVGRPGGGCAIESQGAGVLQRCR